MKKKLVYVAHPFGGKESNRKKIDAIMGELVLNDLNHDYVSPIHNYGYVYLTGDEYQKGLVGKHKQIRTKNKINNKRGRCI